MANDLEQCINSCNDEAKQPVEVYTDDSCVRVCGGGGGGGNVNDIIAGTPNTTITSNTDGDYTISVTGTLDTATSNDGSVKITQNSDGSYDLSASGEVLPKSKIAFLYTVGELPDPFFDAQGGIIAYNKFTCNIVDFSGNIVASNVTMERNSWSYMNGCYLYWEENSLGGGLSFTNDVTSILNTDGRYVVGNTNIINSQLDTYDRNRWIYLYGIGSYNMDATNVNPVRFGQINDFSNNVPLTWETSGTNRVLKISAGTYMFWSYDGLHQHEVTIATDRTFIFTPGAYIGLQSQSNELYLITNVNDEFNYDKNMYILGWFDYLGGNNNVYINGFGNYPDTPASLYAGNANIIGTPSTFSPSWVDENTFRIPQGTYIAKNSTTGTNDRIQLSANLDLPYDFSSVIYYTSALDGFSVAPTASIPQNAIVVGSMNNINGIATVFINGLKSFQYGESVGTIYHGTFIKFLELTVTWQPLLQVTISSTDYKLINHSTNEIITITQPSVTLPYYEGNLIGWNPQTQSLGTGLIETFPDGTIVVGSCNNINGTDAITLFGIDTFYNDGT